MKTPIENLYCWKESFNLTPLSEKYLTLQKEVNKNFEEFYNSLSVEQKQKYDEYETGEIELAEERIQQFFKEGFKLGLALTSESLLNG
ncbi:MAG: hypothetical protein K2O89_06700 [Clostridia bacterium]|nr:hypothetical protein [Clostridia bacterium]